MVTSPASVSVIICAHTEERYDYLVAAIASVKQQTVPPQEIIVVIDHNIDLLHRIQSQVSGVIFVENCGTQGLANARNTGIKVATGTLVAFLDDDAVAVPSWLEHLSKGFTDQRVIGLGGVLTPMWEAKEPSWFPAEFYWVVGCSYRGIPQTVTSIRNPIGANMAFRRCVFDEIGDFQMGRVGARLVSCDETELCIRARQILPDSIILHQPQANVFHHVPAKRTTWKYFFSRCYAEGISKAMITQSVGTRDSLSSEYTYLLHVLPIGVLRGLSDGLFRFDFAGWGRAGAIIAGLLITVSGYVIGKMTNLAPGHTTALIVEAIPQKSAQLLGDKV